MDDWLPPSGCYASGLQRGAWSSMRCLSYILLSSISCAVLGYTLKVPKAFWWFPFYSFVAAEPGNRELGVANFVRTLIGKNTKVAILAAAPFASLQLPFARQLGQFGQKNRSQTQESLPSSDDDQRPNQRTCRSNPKSFRKLPYSSGTLVAFCFKLISGYPYFITGPVHGKEPWQVLKKVKDKVLPFKSNKTSTRDALAKKQGILCFTVFLGTVVITERVTYYRRSTTRKLGHVVCS